MTDSKRLSWLLPGSLFFIILIVYAWSAPRTVVFEDDGLFILSAYFNGISHPPGYPLYTLLSHLATLFPVGSVAWRVHMVSGLFGALSCLCLWWLVKHWLGDRLYASTAALLYGFSATFWSQAIISEVYTLNVFIFLSLCILAVRWEELRESSRSGAILCWIGFLYGLGLSNHWPLMVLSTPMLLAFMWHSLRFPISHFLKPVFFLLLGLTPYVWMVLRSQMNPEISFYGPIESLSEFWFYVSRQGYVEQDSNIGAGLIDKLRFLLFTLDESARQFAYIPAILVLIGLATQARYFKVSICVGLLLGYLGSTFLLVLLLGFNFDQLHKNIFKVYPLISWAVLAIWMTTGLKFLVDRITGAFSPTVSPVLVKRGLVCLGVIPVLLINLPLNYRAGDRLAENYAGVILESLDKNSVFVTYTDIDTGPVGYMHHIENMRPDVLLLNADGFLFKERLYKATLKLEDKFDIFARYLEREERPVYFIRGIPNVYGYNDYGLYLKVDKSLPKGSATAIGDKHVVRFFQELLLTEDLVDPWEYMAQRLLFSDYCRISAHFHLNKLRYYTRDNLVKICRGFNGLITLVEVLFMNGYEDTGFLIQRLDRAAEIREQAIGMDNLARLEYLYGRLALNKGDDNRALAYFRRSMDIWPSDNNEAGDFIRQLQSAGN